MITAAQMRAGRALLGIDQQTLADLAGVSLPTIQRMEASEGNVRGVVDTLTKVVAAFDRAGVELIAEAAPSTGHGRGVRFKSSRTAKSTARPSSPGRKKGRLSEPK
jgi:transcriptional regulator with XRE-family HTH domain